MPRLGVIGSMVWDEIHGRDPLAAPVEEWGGIAYALAALDAALPPEWEIVPLIKVGRDLAQQAGEFLSSLRHLAPSARFIEVPVANQRVTLHYESTARRCERMSGGVPAWTWPELGPMVTDLDALYVNFISGFEMCLGTSENLRRGFAGPIYADLHSLFLAKGEDGIRVLQPLPNAPTWFSFFDVVQCNEDELAQLGEDPLIVAAAALEAGVSLLNVTMGERGVVYFAKPGFEHINDRASIAGVRSEPTKEVALSEARGLQPATGRTSDDQDGPRSPDQDSLVNRIVAPSLRSGRPVPASQFTSPAPDSLAIRTALLSPPLVDVLDPTGCGDVFGATCFAHLLGGEEFTTALTAANAAAARNATFRGASGLAGYLRGELVLA